MLVQDLISSSKYGVKCPYQMSPIGICVHNTANDASAKNEVSYMKSNNQEVSFHIAVDDKEAIQAIPFDRNAWAAGDGGNGRGNRFYIHVEICYSKSGGDRFIEAEKRAAKEIAAILKSKGWNINNVKKHQDFSGKYCPHRTLDMGWQRFLNMISAELNSGSSSSKVDVFYQSYANGRWWGNIKNLEDYSGVIGQPIQGVYCNPSSGTVKYRVHLKGGNWLPWVANRSDYAGIFGKNIDGIQFYLEGLSGKSIRYRVYASGRWLPWVKNLEDYAGIFGKNIEAIQAEIV